jgi:hypothetical protein
VEVEPVRVRVVLDALSRAEVEVGEADVVGGEEGSVNAEEPAVLVVRFNERDPAAPFAHERSSDLVAGGGNF